MGPSSTVTTRRQEAACFSHGPLVSLLLAAASGGQALIALAALLWCPPGHVRVHLRLLLGAARCWAQGWVLCWHTEVLSVGLAKD